MRLTINPDRLVEIRKRQTRHSTLKMIDAATETARDDFAAASQTFETEFRNARDESEQAMQREVQELEKRVEDEKQKGQSPNLQRMMVDKGVCTADEFYGKLQQVDREDGSADGKAPL